jgi:hypothetical protein
MLIFSAILNDIEIQKISNLEGTKQEITLKLITYVISNLYKSKNNLFELISSYTGMEIEKVTILDCDQVIESFQDIFSNGIPKVLKNMIDVEALKKKLE